MATTTLESWLSVPSVPIVCGNETILKYPAVKLNSGLMHTIHNRIIQVTFANQSVNLPEDSVNSQLLFQDRYLLLGGKVLFIRTRNPQKHTLFERLEKVEVTHGGSIMLHHSSMQIEDIRTAVENMVSREHVIWAITQSPNDYSVTIGKCNAEPLQNMPTKGDPCNLHYFNVVLQSFKVFSVDEGSTILFNNWGIAKPNHPILLSID